MIDLQAEHAEMMRLSATIEARLRSLKERIGDYASAERDYRKEKAKAWATAPREREDGSRLTAAEREDQVDAMTADLRYLRDLAQDTKRGAFAAVDAARDQLSAWQSWIKALEAERKLDRYGPDTAA